ncbi:MAG: tetratricopeptide repeat protein [Candidatus Omnitrophica bacterium]|nr:tetratricopeptide repeat protein [Candidatus Omnitrophota bacterium]
MRKFAKVLTWVLFWAGVAAGTSLIYHETQKAEIYYYKGRGHFFKGDYERAIPLYERTLSFEPAHREALTELAYACLWSGKPEQAINHFQRLLALDPESLRAQKSMADAYSWNKQYAKAIVMYLQVLAVTPEDAGTKRKLAEVYMWDQQYPKAAAVLESHLKQFPRDVRAKFLYAKTLQYKGDTTTASRIYRELLYGEKSQTGGSV